ncbi:MAG: hypothetical protein LPK45_07340 [Bacteroidota bacterium]|nr:hypothetical protein [Bacteroidota bacterium]MDX5430888.1 hypothetical protein [Bacteroidota bacterium]MDX5469635.1 hypothetical protein [Bacteroidota bacterium]
MNKPQQDLKEIRQMMERSSRFMSLSGSSGVLIGFLALLFVSWQVSKGHLSFTDQQEYDLLSTAWEEFILGSFGLVVICLVLSIGLTLRRTLKKGLKVWTSSTKNILGAIGLPMMVGAMLMLNDFNHLTTVNFIPVTLLCYGLGLFFASRYTYDELRIMGLGMLVLGTLSVLVPAYGLLFWSLGFGALHMVYGAIMYFRHER